MITKTLTLKKNAALVETNLQNDLLIYDPVLRTAYVLNQPARRIWNLLTASSDKNEIISAFVNAFGEKVSADLETFFAELEKTNLVFTGNEENTSPVSIEFDFEYTAPTAQAYSEEFLRANLNDEAFATFHDDTYSDIATETAGQN